MPVVRAILSIWRGLRSLAEIFASADEDGILVAGTCVFKPRQGMECSGGAADLLNDDGSRRLMELAQEMEEVSSMICCPMPLILLS